MSRLHYVYEERGTGKDRFVYYCSTCSCVLKVRKDLRPLQEASNPSSRCLACGKPLGDNIECRFGPTPSDWSDVYEEVSTSADVKRTDRYFNLASSFPHFSLGFPPLDSLLRPFSSGRTIVLTGAVSSAVAELASFRAQLPIEAGGLDSAALFIDGGNKSDPYLFSSFAKQRRLKPTTAMRRVATCRVFTFYQLGDLISRHLVRATEDYGTRLVVISDVLGTFNEPELEEREARRVLSAVEEGVALTRKKATVIMTLPAANKYDETVASWADTVLSLTSKRSLVQAELLRHRTRPPAASDFKLAQLMKAAR